MDGPEGTHKDAPIELNPEPGILIESLRDIGYSFESALADIIDNSVSAKASNIWIETRSEGEPTLAVVDDGVGLKRSELIDSLRMGSSDPRKARKSTDLGRFGLGLKTASFSQCRKLTVASKKDGALSAFTWDLDQVVQTNQWTLREITDFEAIPHIDMLQGECGTLVLWENIDRVFDERQTKHLSEQAFLRSISDAEEHIALVFHRFLTYERGYKKISMFLNGGQIEPLDPFNTSHEATISHPVEPISDGVTVQCFTLPHASKYEEKAEYERIGLPGGYQKNQGIYLYRARRLIIYGTWFGLAKKTNLTQLCRVRVDIGNDRDEEWKIDVKKVSAQLPESVRASVRNLINTFNAPSKRVYRRRGAKQTSETMHPVWNHIKDQASSKFLISREHPIIKGFVESLDSDDKRSFENILNLVEASYPTDALFCEFSENHDIVTTPHIEDDRFAELTRTFFETLKSHGENDEQVLAAMRATSIFNSRWEDALNALGIEED